VAALFASLVAIWPGPRRSAGAAPLITLTTSEATAGESIAVSGAGFARVAPVSACLATRDGACLVELFALETNADGSFIGAFPGPDVPNGAYIVLVRADAQEFRLPLEVVESPALLPERIAVTVAMRAVGPFLIGGQGEYEITLTNRGALWAPVPISATLW